MLNNLNNEILIIYSGKDAINNRLVNIAMSKYEKNKLIYHYPFNFIAKNIEKTNIVKYLDNIKKKNNTFPTIYIYDSLNKIKQIIEEKYKEIDIIIYSKEQCDKFNRETFRRYTLFNFILDNLKYKSKNISLYYFTYSDKDNIGEKLKWILKKILKKEN